MKQRIQKFSAVLIAVLMLFAFLPQVSVSADQPYVYSTRYNSGTRDEVCTTLEGTGASAYYTGNYTYDALSDLSASALLSTLRKLMTDTHSNKTSYDDCKKYSKQTDCENENGQVLLLYSSVTTGMSTWGQWNREHVWPKNLGGFKTSGAGSDLHHIRPSDQYINSTRSNLKYGNVTSGKVATGSTLVSGAVGGTYGGGYFEPNDNVKGDVARICLYVYVRWGGDYNKCSSITNVFQSIDVLLEWCEMDPVDTWEMGRNEVVQSIQGNRNVFIDYPELAWLLFNREVPDDMITPTSSTTGGGSTTCEHTTTEVRDAIAPTCRADGYTGNTHCANCGKLLSAGSAIPATGHIYGDPEVIFEATVDANGTIKRVCQICKAVEFEETPKLTEEKQRSQSANGCEYVTASLSGTSTLAIMAVILKKFILKLHK